MCDNGSLFGNFYIAMLQLEYIHHLTGVEQCHAVVDHM